MHHEGRITSKQAEDWETIRTMSDADFESSLEGWYPPGRQTRPAQGVDPAFNHPAQPVVGICWHETRAYCAWLSAQTGQAYRLPTEPEWEAAARGSEGREYAWGKEFDRAHCNTFETHIRGTTPVGVFPGGDAPEGIPDMTGNVWEWTGSIYRPYAYDADDGREDPDNAEDGCVVRGGAWVSGRGRARCASRLNLLPGGRLNYLGFRVVCVSPIR